MALHYHTIYKFHTLYSSWIQSATIPLLNHACGKISLKHSILFPNISSNKCYFTTPSTKMSFIASCRASHPQRLHFQNMLCSGIPQELFSLQPFFDIFLHDFQVPTRRSQKFPFICRQPQKCHTSPALHMQRQSTSHGQNTGLLKTECLHHQRNSFQILTDMNPSCLLTSP